MVRERVSSGGERSGQKATGEVRLDLANPHYFRRCHARDVTDHDAAPRHRIIYAQHGGLLSARSLNADEFPILQHPKGGLIGAQADFRTAVRITATGCHEP
jgi:hypothetical protein